MKHLKYLGFGILVRLVFFGTMIFSVNLGAISPGFSQILTILVTIGTIGCETYLIGKGIVSKE